MKLYLEPIFKTPDTGEGGIRRLVEAQRRYFPEFGVELVDDIRQADLTAGHGGAIPLVPGKPFVSMSHGLYWSDYRWEHGEANANRRVIDSLVCADAITVPSQWVRGAYVRGLLREPQVIYHGVELAEWEPSREPGNYVLWNKPRHDAVSNANDLIRLAQEMTDTPFISTLGTPAKNVRLTGRVPYAQMKDLVRGAGVYLATARETFGIGTLEALASGVPVAGWNYGGQREIIIPGETGYLAEYGDYAALAECVHKCFADWTRLSANARADAAMRWQWRDKIEQYAQLYREVLEKRQAEPTVSIIVTCHNLAKYLPEALQSVMAQSMRDFECIIVDDDSSDDTPKIGQDYAVVNPGHFRYVRTPSNLKLSGARNFGFAQASGRYVINLDADDVLTSNALALLVNALDVNPHLHIAYGSLDILSEDGKTQSNNSFPRQFNYLEQMAHLNQAYYAALMRREVWEQTGGYRERMWRAEDAEFWCRATSFGFRAAKVTEDTCLLWRFRADGKSATERKQYPDIDGDWTADFPWATAHNMQDGIALKKANRLGAVNFDAIPFGAPIKDPRVWHREKPLVSIIIPLGPGHERYVIDALDSCVAQTLGNWEAVVVNDTGQPLGRIAGAPYARIIQTSRRVGAGAARNLGLDAARGSLVLFLDADDTLDPQALALMVEAYAKSNASYVYSGWRVIRPDKTTIEFPAQPYNALNWLTGAKEGRHIVSVLMATEDALRIQFDDEMVGYEDWDFFCRCAVEGLCGAPVNQILVTYRHDRGQRSVAASPHHAELVQEIRNTYSAYVKGAKQMAKCCGGNKRALQEIENARAMMRAQQNPVQLGTMSAANVKEPVPAGFTRMKFIGERRGPVTYYVKGRPYTGANSEDYRYLNAKSEDVDQLERMGVWVRVREQPPAPPVVPVQAVTMIETPPAPAPLPEPAPLPVAVEAPEPALAVETIAAPAPQVGTVALAPKRTRKGGKRNGKVGI